MPFINSTSFTDGIIHARHLRAVIWLAKTNKRILTRPAVPSGSFPEQRLVIEPSVEDAKIFPLLGTVFTGNAVAKWPAAGLVFFSNFKESKEPIQFKLSYVD